MSDAQKTALIEYDTDHGKVKLSPAIVKRYLVSGKAELVSDTEVIMFMQLCRYQGLNPFLREAYLIKYGSSPATMVGVHQGMPGLQRWHHRGSRAQEGIGAV